MKETQLLFSFAQPDPPLPPREQRVSPPVEWDDKEAQYLNRHFGVSADPKWNSFQRIFRQTNYDINLTMQLTGDNANMSEEEIRQAQEEWRRRREVARARRRHL